MPTSTYRDLITLAAAELNLTQLGISVAPPLDQYLLDRLVTMVDSWNIQPTIVPWYQQQVFPLVSGQQSYLIGPNAPDWSAPRPIRLDPRGCNLLMGGPPLPITSGGMFVNSVQLAGPTIQVNGVLAGDYYAFQVNGVDLSIPLPVPVASYSQLYRNPLTVLSVQQWANISAPYLGNQIPTGIYLDRSVQTGINNGSPYTASRISLWGVPSGANGIELFYWYALTVGSLNDAVNAPPGYFRAMFLNLAVEVAAGFGVSVPASTARNAADALGNIKNLNEPDMAMQCDRGMPGTGSGWISRAQFESGNW